MAVAGSREVVGLRILWLSAGLKGVNADAHRAAPLPRPPAQAPCSSISLQPHLVSVTISCCSQSLLPPQVSHPSSSTSTVMPVLSSQAQNHCLHSTVLILSVVAPAPRGQVCFLAAFTRLLPHQQESSIYTKNPNQKQSRPLS